MQSWQTEVPPSIDQILFIEQHIHYTKLALGKVIHVNNKKFLNVIYQNVILNF